MQELISEIKECKICEEFLPLGAKPVVTGSKKSKIVIIGQAPGKIVHHTGIAWNDRSGENLRNWMNVSRDEFYNTDIFALMPMGFCYPGSKIRGDLPPRKECAPQWHQKLLNQMKNVQLKLLVGLHSQKYYLGSGNKKNLTESVRHFHEYLPDYFPLPHPSPRNNIWQKKNPWFQQDVVPFLQNLVQHILKN